MSDPIDRIYGARIEALRVALKEALDAWLGYVEGEQMADSHEDRRIAELRKLTEAT